MSKSYKLKGDNYINSAGIEHNRNLLSAILNNYDNKFSSCGFYYNRLGGNSNAAINLTSCIIFASRNGKCAVYMVDTWGIVAKVSDNDNLLSITTRGETFDLTVTIHNNIGQAIELFIIKNTVQS